MTTQTDTDALVASLGELRTFLDGSGPLAGSHFGERRLNGTFWWRKYLTRMERAATHITTQSAQIAALTDRVRVLMEYLGEQAAFAQTRIQDGIEMGATVWRIALEDIARENHTALKGSDHDD